MRVLVTGGAGYIGSVAVQHLLNTGDSVAVFDNLSVGHRAAIHADAQLIEGDLANLADIDNAIADFCPDAIMHFASNTLVGESMHQPMKYLGDNVVNGVHLLKSVAKHGVGRLILSSTANLFDDPPRIPIDEKTTIQPGSPYGESKFILERMLYWLEQTIGLRFAALRYFNAAGATEELGEDHEPETHLIPLVLQVALGQREHVTIFGNDYPTRDGTCVRDYIHIADLARAHVLALKALDNGSRVYNLGNGQGYSVLEVVETVREISGHPIPVIFGPRRAGDPAELVASSEKIYRELGWLPEFGSLHDIIHSAWDWHRRHPLGYGDKSP